MSILKRQVREGSGFMDGREYTVYHRTSTREWIPDFSYDTLEEAEQGALRESRNNTLVKVIDSKGRTISMFKDFLKIKGSHNEENNYSSNMGVDTIEDIMAAGLDWTQADFEYPVDEPRDYDDASKLITIAQAEKVIGERPDASKPKPPTSKNPRPDTIRKYRDAIATYKDRVKELSEWERKFNRLVALVQLLRNTQDRLDDLREDLSEWAVRNPGTFIIRQGRDSYTLVSDPDIVLDKFIKKLGVPDEITSLDGNTSWNFDNIDFDEDKDVFPSVLITVGKNMIRFISIPDDLNDITYLIEDYVDTIQPKDLSSMTYAKLDQKAKLTLETWKDNKTTNADLTPEEKELKLYLAAEAFLKEIQQLNKYPSLMPTRVGKLVNNFLQQI